MERYDLNGFHCPRWEELPDLGLYMDQVLFVVENALHPLFPRDEVVLTSTMVNNYVKQEILPASQKKKYSREHLARLILISVLKRVLSVAEMKFVLERMGQGGDAQWGYNLFCIQLELRLQGGHGTEDCDPVLAAALDAVAGKLRFEAKCAEVQEG